MYNPDENIDHLSREAAEHYNAPGKPSWDALRQTLDKELPQEKEKKRRGFLFFFLLALGLSLAGSVTWYGVHTHGTPVLPAASAAQKKTGTAPDNNIATENNTAVKNNNHKATNAAAVTQPAGSHPVAIQKVNAQNSAPVATINAKAGTIKTTSIAGSIHVHKTDIVSRNRLANINTNKSGTAQITTGSKKQPHQLAVRKDLTVAAGNEKSRTAGSASLKNKKSSTKGTGEDSEAIVLNDTNTKDVKEDAVAGNESATQVAAPPPGNKVAPAAKDTLAAHPAVAAKVKTDSVKTAATKVKSKSNNDKAILLGLTGGLDFSTVNYTHGSNPGYNVGLMGGYQFNKHWSVYTGIVYTKKNYKLNGKDYHPPDSYWTNWVDLQTVAGYCRMWELPVLARYTFNHTSGTAFFASAGLSSYFMKQQEYDYTFKTNGNVMNSAWSDEKNLNHIFSILNLSAGFQKQIGKHMNWQVEPYAKIPLGGVGFGNIKLSSFGVNLTVQYRKPLKH